MPTLELLIDATGMQRGAQTAKAALDDVSSAAAKTQASIRDIYGSGTRVDWSSLTRGAAEAGKSLSSAFQVGSGGIQIATGITQAAQAFGQLNTAAGLFAASRILLEIGNTARDFQQLGGAVGGAASAWRVLGTAIAANPIGAAAVAIGAVATAFALFGDNARKALVDYKALADEVAKNSIFAEADRILGISNPANVFDQRLSSIRTLTAGVTAGQGVNFGQIQSTAGISTNELLTLLRDLGNADATDLLNKGRFQRRANVDPTVGGLLMDSFTDPNRIDISKQEAEAALRILYQSTAFEANRLKGPTVEGGTLPEFVVTGDSRSDNDRFLAAQAGAEAEERVRRYNEALIEQAERLENAARAAEQFGATIGGALFDAISGANTLRGALAAAFQSIARQGFESGVAGIFGTITRGLTQTQQLANSGVPTAGGAGVTTTGP